MVGLFDTEYCKDSGPYEFRRTIQRLMLQNGWDAFSIDGPGDWGGDIYAERDGVVWVIQSKWKRNGVLGLSKQNGDDVVNQTLEARHAYNAHKAVIVTNGYFSQPVLNKVRELADNGIDIECWDNNDLVRFAAASPFIIPSKQLRPYQAEAYEAIKSDLDVNNRSLLYLATGLGKTVVAGQVVRHVFEGNPEAKVLIIAHLDELIEQLQRAFWTDVPLNVKSRLINKDAPDDIRDLSGLTIATNLSICKYLESGYFPDLVVVDECHRVGNDNTYGKILSYLEGVPKLGVTATPWRGDGFKVSEVFGDPTYTCSIEDGMRQGYLAPVEYKLYCDNIDWAKVADLSENEYTVDQLNRKLFIPQRDDTIIDALSEQWLNIKDPKCIVFCQSVSHAEKLHERISRYARWNNAELLHSKLDKNQRKLALLKFRNNECNILIAVDILNEGIDVPTVNLVCFARVTHSRRIFVQQLGRGLRISPGKDKVVVLDFAADIRRIRAVNDLRTSVNIYKGEEVVDYDRNNISFTDQSALEFIDEWIKDAASLDEASQSPKLQFPIEV